RRFELPGQEAAPERAVGHEGDPQLAHGGQNLRLRVAAPQRVLGLECRDRVDLRRPADRRRRRLGQAQAAYLPRLDAFQAPPPALTSSATAPTVSSMAVLGSTRCW